MNAKMSAARERALAILKPTSKELEHGLELHRNAIVFDSYGFAPMSAVDGDVLREAKEEGASTAELNDLALEMRYRGHLADCRAKEEYDAAWEASGVTCVFQNAGEEGQSPLRMLRRLAHLTSAIDENKGFLRRATCPPDIEKAKDEGLRCLYMTTNGVPLSQEWRSAEEELAWVRIFAQLGCRMMHMTYNRRNMLGDGCMEPSDAGLSDFGRAAVKELNRTGVICDVAHSGLRTSLETAKASSRPVVSSHSCCWSLRQHQRAKTDEVIKAIADTGGYNGICCISGFLGGNGDISSLLDHIDYIVSHFGADHVAIGSDNGYSSFRSEEEWTKVGAMAGTRPTFESFWQPGSLPPPSDISLAWTNWPLFTVGLVQRGHSDDVIRKIIGGNVMRVAKAAFE